jgi:hypothetical protein
VTPSSSLDPSILPIPQISTPRRPCERLLWMACIAQLTSAPLDPDNLSSDLTLVWWQDAFARPLPDEISAAVAEVAWGALREGPRPLVKRTYETPGAPLREHL